MMNQTPPQPLRGSILVVDDDDAMRQLLRRILRSDGYDIEEAVNGTQALAMYEKLQPDVVLLDVMMPGLNGFEVCTRLRALPGAEHTSIILITAMSDSQAVDRAFAAGAVDYITKPIHLAVLRQRVRRLLATKRAEEEVHFQTSLLKHVRNAIIATDEVGFINYWSQQAQTLFQWTADETIGQNSAELLFTPDSHSLSTTLFTDVMRMGSWEGEFVMQRKDRATFCAHLTLALIKNSLDRIEGFVGVVTDITEQKQAEAALKEREASFRNLFADNPHPMWVYDVETLHFLDVNEAAILHYGYSREEFLRMRITDIRPSEDVPTLLTNLEQRRTNVENSSQWRHRLKNGQLIDVEINSHLLEFAGRKAALVVALNVTKRKQAEEALESERNLLRTLIDNLPDYIYVKDKEGRFVISNIAHAEAAQGLTPDELLGKTAFELFPPELAAQYHADDQAIIQSGQALINLERITVDATGKRRAVLTTKVPLRDRDGNPMGVVGLSRDITDRKRVEEKLEDERNLLRTVIDAIPDYVYVKNTESQFILGNAALAAGLGAATPDSIVGKTDFNFYTQDMAAGFYAHEQALIQSGQPLLNLEETIITPKTGNQRQILTTKVPLRNSNGVIIGLVGIGRDITERKKAEEASLFLSSLVEATDDAIIGITAAGIVRSWNTGAEKLYGYSQAEMQRRQIAILAPDDGLDEVHQLLEKIGGGEQISHYETLHVRKDGKMIDVALTISPLKNSAGITIGASTIARDISERKRAERELSEHRYQLQRLVAERTTELTAANDALRQEIAERNWAEKALRQGEDQLRRITDNMLDIICQTDMRGIIQYASPSCWNVLGYTPEALIGHSIYEWMHPDDLDAVMIAIRTVGRVEYRHRHANGQYVWLETLSNLLFEDESSPKGIILASRDITQRKHATQALQQSEERFRQLAENIDETFWMTSADHQQLIYVSPAYERMSGRTCESFYEQPFSFLTMIHPDERERILASLDQQLGGDYDEEYRIIRPDGVVRWIRNRAFPIQNDLGEIYRIAGILDDVTERKRVEQELQEINRLKTEFLSTAAHELRTPLTSIRGFSEILLTRKLDEARQKRYLSLIEDQSVHLGEIIDDLLDVSRLEAKRNLALNLERISMAELIDKALTPFVESESKHLFRVEGLQDCPLIVADAFRLSQVVKNLLSNAVKYSPNGGTITIRGQIIKDNFQLSVQDTGIGMTAEHQSHLFEKFYRADASNTAISGTGLGLAISKLIVELHSGKIWAESEDKVGTTFYMTLPLLEDQIDESQKPSNLLNAK